jgi:RHS repeat-associated protein
MACPAHTYYPIFEPQKKRFKKELTFAKTENKVRSGYLYGFNGKEEDNEVKGEGNSLDFGARMYDARLGRWLSRDPKEKQYPTLSPYVFVSNQPILAIDPDGRLIIYVNGEVGQFGPIGASNASQRANVSYWGQMFVDKVNARLQDYNNKFVDGDQGGNPVQRYGAGYKQAQANAADIIKNLKRDENGNIIESINFITHSKGAEYANGYIDALNKEITKQLSEGVIKYADGVAPIALVIHNAPHQSDAINVKPTSATTISVSHIGDPLSDDDARGDILNIMTKKEGRTDPAGAHSISGFLYEDLRLIDAYLEHKEYTYDLKYDHYADHLNDVQTAHVGPSQ